MGGRCGLATIVVAHSTQTGEPPNRGCRPRERAP